MLGRWDARTLTLPSNFELTSTRSTGYSKSGLCTCTKRSAVLSCTHVRQRACTHATGITTDIKRCVHFSVRAHIRQTSIASTYVSVRAHMQHASITSDHCAETSHVRALQVGQTIHQKRRTTF
jgi:hypothetical protein